jgi:hypothetical protein
VIRGGWNGNLSLKSISKLKQYIDLSRLEAPYTAVLSTSSYIIMKNDDRDT